MNEKFSGSHESLSDAQKKFMDFVGSHTSFDSLDLAVDGSLGADDLFVVKGDIGGFPLAGLGTQTVQADPKKNLAQRFDTLVFFYEIGEPAFLRIDHASGGERYPKGQFFATLFPETGQKHVEFKDDDFIMHLVEGLESIEEHGNLTKLT